MSLKSLALKAASYFVPFAHLFFNDKKDPSGSYNDRGGGSAVKNAANGVPPAPSTPNNKHSNTIPLAEEIAQNLVNHSSNEPTGPVPDARPLVENKGPEI
jgi:hypothetical protein